MEEGQPPGVQRLLPRKRDRHHEVVRAERWRLSPTSVWPRSLAMDADLVAAPPVCSRTSIGDALPNASTVR